VAEEPVGMAGCIDELGAAAAEKLAPTVEDCSPVEEEPMPVTEKPVGMIDVMGGMEAMAAEERVLAEEECSPVAEEPLGRVDFIGGAGNAIATADIFVGVIDKLPITAEELPGTSEMFYDIIPTKSCAYWSIPGPDGVDKSTAIASFAASSKGIGGGGGMTGGKSGGKGGRNTSSGCIF
jgi:hypothetical protein